jgi:signal transduction histidine kinase
VTREEALRVLRVGSAGERREAARTLAQLATSDDIATLQQARHRELDHYVRTALDDALALTGERVAEDRTETLAAERASQTEIAQTRSEIQAQALQETTYRIVHELRKAAGFVRDSASEEFEDFPHSRTYRDLETLHDLLDAVERLGQVAATPTINEFDLAGLILDTAVRVETDCGVQVEHTGPRPLLVSSDGALVELAVRNGLQNACEAVAQLEESDREPVVVGWNSTDRDFWVVVLDTGPGLPRNGRDPFTFADSQKQGHLGVGLALARQAARTLHGEITLTPRDGGGMAFEFRCPLPEQAT